MLVDFLAMCQKPAAKPVPEKQFKSLACKSLAVLHEKPGNQYFRRYSYPHAQTTAPGDYPLVFKFPEKCGVRDCTVYVGIQSNEGNASYLDFYIEGDAKAWVAVGFTPTPSMV